MKGFSVLFLASCLLSRPVFSQEKERFENLTIRDGLSHNNVLSIMQDRRGFIWFGTYNGLNRYDGYKFRVFNFNPYDTTSVSQHLILCLFEDRDGVIWVGTAGMGLCRFDPATEKFTRYTADSENPQALHHSTVTAIGEDQQGMLWVGTVAGLTRFDKKTGVFHRYVHDPDDTSTISSNGPINAIYKDKTGALWLGTGNNVINRIHFKPGSNLVEFIRYPLAPADIQDNHAVAFCEDDKGILWIGTLDGLIAFNRSNGVSIQYRHDPRANNSLSSDRVNIRALAADDEGNIWIGTGNGLNKFNPERGAFSRFYHDPSDPLSVVSNDIHCIIMDNSSTMWFGTVDGGVSKFDPRKRWFPVLKFDPANPNSLSADAVRAIYEDRNGILWIGTEGGGLNRFDRRAHEFRHFRHNPNDKHSLCSDFIASIMEDNKGNLWIGNGGSNFYSDATSGITVRDRAGNFRRLFKEKNDPLRIADVFTIYEGRDSRFWIGTEAGFRSYDPASGQCQIYQFDPANKNGVSDGWIYVILQDKRGDIWVGTGSNALNKFNPVKETFTHYRYDPANTRSITSNSVKSIYEDTAGRLWFGTSGGGLCLYHPETDDFTAFTTAHGLPDNTIYNILADDDGDLWLSTNKGISRFSPATKAFLNFDSGDGLQSNQFASGYVNTGAAFKGKDGTLYFGGQHGVTMVNPDQIRLNDYVPPLVITEFRLFDKPDPVRQNAEQIVLSYNENFFSFEFAALSYTNPGRNQYAYKLENFDNKWIYSGNRRYASYTNLDPGQYVFKVKGSNNDGLWNEEGVSVIILVTPPWWMTTTAHLVYALIAICILLGIYYYIVSRERMESALKIQRMEAEKMHELDQMKSKFFANISHEFRTPLTLILGHVENLLQKPQHPDHSVLEVINRNARRLLKLINQLLQLSRLEAGNMRVDYQSGDVMKFIRAIVHAFSSYAESRGIAFNYDIPATSQIVRYDPEKLEIIINNLLSNALKYTSPGGMVNVKVRSTPTTSGNVTELDLTAEDNGVGIPKEFHDKIFDRFYQIEGQSTIPSEGTGIGLALSREVAVLMGGTLTVKSEGTGSAFRLVLPLRVVNEVTQENDDEGDRFGQPAPRGPERTQVNKATTTLSEQASLPVVLVVEDSEDLRRYVGELLSTEYQVLEADSGDKGLQAALRHIPDLVICDVMIPGLDGVELCRKLKNDERSSHIPVILLTAKASDQDRLEGLESGADDYVTKPFKRAELLARARNLIEQRKNLRKSFSTEIRLEPKAIKISSADERFLRRALAVVERYLADPEFSVDMFGRELGMSRTQLYRKLVALTDQAPGDFIKSIRIKRAASLLLQQYGNIAEVAFATGFDDPSYFSRSFRDVMGQSPTEYISSQQPKTEVP